MSDACEMPRSNATSEEIYNLLKKSSIIAVVGLSDKPERESYQVASYLKQVGYRIIPVNPAIPEVMGEKSYASLTEIPEKVEIVNIFRRPEAVPPIVEEAIRIGASTVWMQEGIVHNEAADRARASGLQVVMNRCILKEHINIRR